jgi:hypothetical protein
LQPFFCVLVCTADSNDRERERKRERGGISRCAKRCGESTFAIPLRRAAHRP